MICHFPAAYPDELLYSQLSRYYVQSGYLSYIYAAEELFCPKTVRPNMEFITPLTEAALWAVTKDMSIETVVQRHTMFPYYGHFLPKERRQKAFQSLVTMGRDYCNHLPLPKNGEERYLRYCPLCGGEDRNTYGETYWHRAHQMLRGRICPTHGCYLVNSDVPIGSNAPPMLKAAEEIVPMEQPTVFADNDLEIQLVQYMATMIHTEVNLEADVSIGQFLHSKLTGTPYCSVRGEQRNIRLLHEEFMEYYRSIPYLPLPTLWQIQKILTDARMNAHETCLLALFLQVPACELVNRTLPDKTHEQLFDEEVHRLHEQGLKYPEIAQRMNASYDVVKAIGGGRYGKHHKSSSDPLKCGTKTKNWQQVDEDTLPLVREVLRQLHEDTQNRPVKISVSGIEKMLHLPNQRIRRYLPKCHEEILQYTESWKRYWAREVVWAARKLQESGKLLCWRISIG